MWAKNDPGDNPVCIIGAGFQRAVLDPPLPMPASKDPMEKNIIEKTFSESGAEFPALSLLGPRLTKTDLNYVWTNIYRISEFWQSLTPEVIKTYKDTFSNKPMGYLVESLRKRSESLPPSLRNPASLLCTILGVELKRMLALQYNQKRLKLKDRLPCGLVNFLDATRTKIVTWISLNYELSLESVLESPACPKKWRYGFDDLFEGLTKEFSAEIGHVIVKPHGSLNIWFTTIWESREGSGKRNLHQLSVVDTKQRFTTCPSEEIGAKVGSNPVEERRPWIIGYLPDEMKDELNSPALLPDPAHDLCKLNMSYAGLALQRASSLYVLAYSMPDEDRWIWERLAALRSKDFPVYVASRNDSDRIIMALKSHGFPKTQKLSTDGGI